MKKEPPVAALGRLLLLACFVLAVLWLLHMAHVKISFG